MREKIKYLSGILLMALFAISCEKNDVEASRSFYMGFTPFPYDISQEAVDFTYDAIAKNADIINHHFDNGVPWQEALDNQPFHPNVINDWTFRKSATPSGHKVYVSVAPINLLRNGLALNRGEFEDMALTEPWNEYTFSDEQVKLAYLNYCKRIIDFFLPDYFNMAIEANLLYYNKPELWSDFLEFHQYIYTQLKSAYPELVIFSSVTGAHMLNGFFPGNDYSQQRLAALQIIEHSDLYALSFYPYLSSYLGNPYPPNTLPDLFNISEKPLAIAETGYAAQNFAIDSGSGLTEVISNAERQNAYIVDLLAECQKRRAVFVINFVLRDYDALWEKIGAQNDLTVAWRDTGLYSETGDVRPALTTWKDFLSMKHSQQRD